MRITLLILCILLSIQSCKSSVYKDKIDNNNFTKLEVGKVYTFYGYNREKQAFKVSEIKKDSIFGVSGVKNVELAKSNIRVVKKSNPAATTAIVVGSVAGVALITYIMVDAIRDFGDVIQYPQ